MRCLLLTPLVVCGSINSTTTVIKRRITQTLVSVNRKEKAARHKDGLPGRCAPQ